MLAKHRILKIGRDCEIKTPILLPSFSSKGFPNVEKIIQMMSEVISDHVLVSCYDLYHKHINGPFDFASMVYLDSGGYEASKDTELSETFEKTHVVKDWDAAKHQSVVDGWVSKTPTVFVNYDHPRSRTTVKEQIARAKSLRIPEGPYGRALLLKPETEDSRRLKIEDVLPHVKEMDGFSVIGVTEKEIGNSLLQRMVNIAKLRKALDKHHVDLPIHVFGCLDTIATYLYFLAGADIFDGLTWLRYAFLDGNTVYRHSYGAMKLAINTNSDVVEAQCWSHNYSYIQDMMLAMERFVADKDFSRFKFHIELIKDACDSMDAKMVGE